MEKTVNSVTTEYAYDDIDQLVSEVRNGYSASYTYDANGNRTSKTLNGTTQSYVVDDADKLISITQGGNTVKSFTYDAAGRTTAVTVGSDTTTLAYDYESRITQITYPNQSTNTFAYNGLDTRVSKVDSTGTRTYLRDGVYVTDPVLSDGAATYTPGISERRSSATKFYHPDRLGTTERLADTSQNTTDTRQYDAFGLLTNSSGSTPTPFGFAGAWGYQEDPDSGLKLLGHRYYDPSTGRFLTRDPIKDGRNWYGYCSGNPARSVDPEGQQAIVGALPAAAGAALADGPLPIGDAIAIGILIAAFFTDVIANPPLIDLGRLPRTLPIEKARGLRRGNDMMKVSIERFAKSTSLTTFPNRRRRTRQPNHPKTLRNTSEGVPNQSLKSFILARLIRGPARAIRFGTSWI